MVTPAKPRDLVCPACSKSVKSGSLVLFQHGEMFHVACISRAQRWEAMERGARSRDARAWSAARLIKESTQLRRSLGSCATCGHPFRKGGGYLRRPDGRPVHVGCPDTQ
jgi:hypothetical protein